MTGAVAFAILIAALVCEHLRRKHEKKIRIYCPLFVAGALVVVTAGYFAVRVLLTVLSVDGFLWSVFGVGNAPAFALAVRCTTWLLLIELAVGIKFVVDRVRAGHEERGWLATHLALLSSAWCCLAARVRSRRAPKFSTPTLLPALPVEHYDASGHDAVAS